MSGDLDDLARAAADALVSAMLTDSWEPVKCRFAALVGQERRMDAAQSELAATSGRDRDQARWAQVRAWSTRLRDALEDDPALAEALRAVLDDLSAAGPEVPRASAHMQADHGSQAVNMGGGISGNTGEVYVGVGKVVRRKFNLVLDPFSSLIRLTVAVVVVLGAGAVVGWRAHWPPAVFGSTGQVHGAGKPVVLRDPSGFRYVLTVSQGFTKAPQYAGAADPGAPPGSWFITGQVLIHNAQTDRPAPVPEAQVGNSQYFWLFLPGRHDRGLSLAGHCFNVSAVPGSNGFPAFPVAGCVFEGLANEGSENGATYVGSTMNAGATLDFYFAFGPFRDPTILKRGQLYFWAGGLPLTRLPLPT